MATLTPWDRIGVGIDTARYGHRVSFLRPDRQPAAKPLTVLESRAGYTALQERLEALHRQHPQAHFHVRIDAAGQYATNLEHFLRALPLPLTLSIGEPKRNKDYQKAHFPKRTTDDTESQAMARFAVVELPAATAPVSPAMILLREVAGRLQAKVKQSTQAINRLHNLLARVFPELANLTEDIAAAWVLHLLDQYPTAQRIGQARLDTLQKIPYLAPELAEQLHLVAQQSVACLSGAVAEALVRDLVAQVRHTQRAEDQMRRLLSDAYAALPASPHLQVVTVPGIGVATAAALVAQSVDINRFATPERFVGYFGVFPEENTSGVDKFGNPVPPGTMRMSPKGNDLVRHYLWNAARSAIVHNPAIADLYRRLKAKGKRGDVALGQCMRKLLHLAYAVWKTNRPFDPKQFAKEPSSDNQGMPPTEFNRSIVDTLCAWLDETVGRAKKHRTSSARRFRTRTGSVAGKTLKTKKNAMHQILVYADSLTWGIIPNTRQRLPFEARWPGVMEGELVRAGQTVRVIEDCLNGRRTVWDDPHKEGRNGLIGLEQRIEVNSPLALVMLMLGTNDFQAVHQVNARQSAQGIATLVRAIRRAPVEPGMPVPRVLIIAPPPIQNPRGSIAPKFEGAHERCTGLAQAYQQVASEVGCPFFDAGSVTMSSVIDGVHLDRDQHLWLGQGLAGVVSELLNL